MGFVSFVYVFSSDVSSFSPLDVILKPSPWSNPKTWSFLWRKLGCLLLIWPGLYYPVIYIYLYIHRLCCIYGNELPSSIYGLFPKPIYESRQPNQEYSRGFLTTGFGFPCWWSWLWTSQQWSQVWRDFDNRNMGGNTIPATNSHFAPEHRPFAPRGNTSSSPIYCSGVFAVSFREGAWFFGEVVGVYWKNITMGSPTWNLHFLGVMTHNP